MSRNIEPQFLSHLSSSHVVSRKFAPAIFPAGLLRFCAAKTRFSAAMTAMLVLLASAPGTTVAQDRPVPDVFTATTTDMTPAGVALKFSVLRWSDDNERSAVVSTLSSDTDVSKALADLPTVGYVWPSESPVGYSIKYAQRVQTPDGRERMTFVTDKPVGSHDLHPWTAGGASAAKDAGDDSGADGTAGDTTDGTSGGSAEGTAAGTAGDTLDYSVIVLYPNGEGSGHGTMSLAADVVLDEESNTVSLDEGDAATVLTGATIEPKPYWAQGS